MGNKIKRFRNACVTRREKAEEKLGRRCEYRTSKSPHAVVGMEVTDEGDISFYAEQKVDITDSRSAVRIDRMISSYINLQVDNSLVLAL